ncbi:hypothetical protein KEM54_003437 [Ascosphaera aggregata]|nr:hypothetical protein KEM54_003437 [Ascosphaera aggregata]
MHASEPHFDDYGDEVTGAAPTNSAAGRYTPATVAATPKTVSSSLRAVKSFISNNDVESGSGSGSGSRGGSGSGSGNTPASAAAGSGALAQAPAPAAGAGATATTSQTPSPPQNPPQPATRTRGPRRESLRRQQERQLFTRKKPSGGANLLEDDTDEEPFVRSADEQPAQYLRLHQRQHVSSINEDADAIPPTAASVLSDLDVLVSSYMKSSVANSVRDDINAAVTASAMLATEDDENTDTHMVTPSRTSTGTSSNLNLIPGGAGANSSSRSIRSSYTTIPARISWLRQFIILSQRTWRNLYRNPMLMLMHYAIAIVLAVLSGYLFYGLTDDIKGFQNRLGLFFFLLALFGFSTLTSLNVFASERLLFVRERANGYYSPVTYFAAKVVFDIIPLRLIPPMLMGMIVYPMVGLVPAWPEFLRFMLILVLFNMASAAICLFIGILFRDQGVASLVGSLVMLFSLLFAGLLLNHDAIPKSAIWLQSLSIFHYGFEALIVNEVTYLTLIDHKYGLNIEVPGASILSAFGFDTQALFKDVIGLGVVGASFIVIAYIAMHFLLV